MLDKYTPESVVRIGKRLFHKKGAEAGKSHYPHIQEVSKLGKNNISDVGFISQDPKTGRFVIKSLYKKTK